jgi:hypothetical protein
MEEKRKEEKEMDIDIFLHMGKIEEEEQRSLVCCEIRDSKLCIGAFY